MKTKRSLSKFIPFLGFIAILLVFTILTGGTLLSPSNLSLVLEQSVSLLIASMGVTFVMSMGSLDFSQGSLIAICSIAGVYVAQINFFLTAVTMVAIGLGIGFLNGFMVSKLKMQSFIVTICMMFILRGLTIYLMIPTGAVGAPLEFSAMLDKVEYKVIVLVVVFAIGIYLFEFSKFGKQCKAIGTGELAAIYAGVKTQRIKILAFTLAGATCGLAAFMLMIRTGVAAPATGTLVETDILTVLVLGGLPITGGMHSKIWSGIIGTFMLMFLSNGLVILGADAAALQMAKGIIFLIAVVASREKEGNLVVK